MINQLYCRFNSSAFIEFPQATLTRIIVIALAIISAVGVAYIAIHTRCFHAENPSSREIEGSSDLPEGIEDRDISARDQNPVSDPVIDNPFRDALKTLKNGYAIIPFLPEERMKALFHDLKNFDLLSESYKEQFRVKEQVEIGYTALKNKKIFVIRNQEIPEELKDFLPYLSNVHSVALDILKSIEEDLNLSAHPFIQSVSPTFLPDTGNSTSLLRLFSYSPSLEEVAVDAHEDLGLLTIIPCSEVPALEVMNYQKDFEWINVENLAHPNQAIVLVGRTLEQMTKGKYLAATHRVKQCLNQRFSIVYQLRAEPHAEIQTAEGSTTVEEWINHLKKDLKSVNGSY